MTSKGRGVVRSKGGRVSSQKKVGGGEWSEVKEEGSGQKQGRGEWSEAREGRESGQKQGRGREWSEVRKGEGMV